MRAITTLALAAVLVAAASVSSVEAAAPKWNKLAGYTHDQFAADFGRRYRSAEEKEARRAVFEAKLEEVKAHNAKPGQLYKKGVNQFSDWTADEFKRYNTYQRRTEGVEQMIPIQPYTANGAIIPGAVDWRRASPPVLSGVKNQGHCGSCWAHSTVESIESYFALAFGQLPVLSAQQVTSCTQSMFGCGGGNYFYGFDYVSKSAGLYEEWEYSYTSFFAQNMSKAATSTCRNITEEYFPTWSWVPKANVTGAWAVQPNNATATMEALALHGPLSISVGAGNWDSYESGILYNPTGSAEPWQIDHAVQMVGYGFDEDLQVGYWIVRNSWGTTWGEAGYIRLFRPTDAAEPCGNGDDGRACGTSGCLSSPAFPNVAMLAQKN